MTTRWVDLARHPLALWLGAGRGDPPAAIEAAGDPYASARSQRLQQLEAAGKCLARSGKHGNLRYWPAERGSRVLLEHRRRRQRAPGIAAQLS